MLEDIDIDELLPGLELNRIIARLMGARILTVPFSSDIGTVWPLVEKFRLCVWPTKYHAWLVFQEEFDPAFGATYWLDSLRIEDDEDYTFRDTAPWAICIAVIKLAQQGKINE